MTHEIAIKFVRRDFQVKNKIYSSRRKKFATKTGSGFLVPDPHFYFEGLLRYLIK